MFLLAQIKAKFILSIDNKAKKEKPVSWKADCEFICVIRQRADRKMLTKFNKGKYNVLCCEGPT